MTSGMMAGPAPDTQDQPLPLYPILQIGVVGQRSVSRRDAAEVEDDLATVLATIAEEARATAAGSSRLGEDIFRRSPPILRCVAGLVEEPERLAARVAPRVSAARDADRVARMGRRAGFAFQFAASAILRLSRAHSHPARHARFLACRRVAERLRFAGALAQLSGVPAARRVGLGRVEGPHRAPPAWADRCATLYLRGEQSALIK